MQRLHCRCDGELADPIFRYMHEYSWAGLLVEPLPDLFQRLQHNYRNAKGRVVRQGGGRARDGGGFGEGRYRGFFFGFWCL